MDLCKFKAILGYIRSVQKKIQVVAAHNFNPSPRESHTFNPSTRGNINEKRERLSLQPPSLGRSKASPVFGCLAFLVLGMNIDFRLF